MISREKTSLFTVDGNALLIPDNDLEASYEDLDSEDSGRTLDGVMHRKVVRSAIAKWAFVYGNLSAEDYRYMEGLFAGKSEFTFSYPGPNGTATMTAYRSKSSITLHNAKTGHWKNYKFDVIEC